MNEYGEGAEKSVPGLISHEESGKPAEAAPRPEPEQSRNWKTTFPPDPFIICQLADVRIGAAP